jgi:hypothetical protein
VQATSRLGLVAPALTWYLRRLTLLVAVAANVCVALAVVWSLAEDRPLAHAVAMFLYIGAALLGLAVAVPFLGTSDPVTDGSGRSLGAFNAVFSPATPFERFGRDTDTALTPAVWLLPTIVALVALGVSVQWLFAGTPQ